MEWTSAVLLTTFRTHCFPQVLIMSGQGDAHANEVSKVEKESDASVRESRGVGWVGQRNEHTANTIVV